MLPKFCASLAGATAALALVAGGPALAQYPEDPIQIIVPFSAGGGTDTVARVIGQELSDELGTPVNVVNRPGAGGLTGHSAIAEAEPDGYTLGMITTPLDSHQWVEPGAVNYEDFIPLALINGDPAGFQVRADSEFESFSQVMEAIRTSPEDYTASASGIAGAWHVAWLKLLSAHDVDPNAVVFVPTGGASPSLQELVAGGVDFAPTSLVEARSLIQSGEVRSLAVMSDERLEAFPDVPTVEEETGVAVTHFGWRGFALPKGAPDEVVAMLKDAIETAYQSEAFQSEMDKLGFNLQWREGDAFLEFMKNQFEATGEVLQQAGLAE